MSIGSPRALRVRDPFGARKAYDEFLAIWKDADFDVPILKAAKQSTPGCAKGALKVR